MAGIQNLVVPSQPTVATVAGAYGGLPGYGMGFDQPTMNAVDAHIRAIQQQLKNAPIQYAPRVAAPAPAPQRGLPGIGGSPAPITNAPNTGVGVGQNPGIVGGIEQGAQAAWKGLQADYYGAKQALGRGIGLGIDTTQARNDAQAAQSQADQINAQIHNENGVGSWLGRGVQVAGSMAAPLGAGALAAAALPEGALGAAGMWGLRALAAGAANAGQGVAQADTANQNTPLTGAQYAEGLAGGALQGAANEALPFGGGLPTSVIRKSLAEKGIAGLLSAPVRKELTTAALRGAREGSIMGGMGSVGSNIARGNSPTDNLLPSMGAGALFGAAANPLVHALLGHAPAPADTEAPSTAADAAAALSPEAQAQQARFNGGAQAPMQIAAGLPTLNPTETPFDQLSPEVQALFNTRAQQTGTPMLPGPTKAPQLPLSGTQLDLFGQPAFPQAPHEAPPEPMVGAPDFTQAPGQQLLFPQHLFGQQSSLPWGSMPFGQLADETPRAPQAPAATDAAQQAPLTDAGTVPIKNLTEHFAANPTIQSLLNFAQKSGVTGLNAADSAALDKVGNIKTAKGLFTKINSKASGASDALRKLVADHVEATKAAPDVARAQSAEAAMESEGAPLPKP